MKANSPMEQCHDRAGAHFVSLDDVLGLLNLALPEADWATDMASREDNFQAGNAAKAAGFATGASWFDRNASLFAVNSSPFPAKPDHSEAKPSHSVAKPSTFAANA